MTKKTITTFPANKMTVAEFLNWYDRLDGRTESAWLIDAEGSIKYKVGYDGNDFYLRESKHRIGMFSRAMSDEETINLDGLTCDIRECKSYHSGY